MSNQKTALITGAAQRIGAHLSRSLHSLGINIIIHYRHSSEHAEQLQHSLNAIRPNSAVCLQADLTIHEEVLHLASQAHAAFGEIDILINNASSFYPTPIDTATEQDWDALINSNLKAPYFLTQALASTLKKQHGCVINIADIYGETPLSRHSIYCIAKAGNIMMTKTLAKELAPDVRVNGISPGAILWPAGNTLDEQQKQSIIDKIPLQKTGSPEDIVNTVNFFISQAPYITGQIINLDGGRSLNI